MKQTSAVAGRSISFSAQIRLVPESFVRQHDEGAIVDGPFSIQRGTKIDSVSMGLLPEDCGLESDIGGTSSAVFQGDPLLLRLGVVVRYVGAASAGSDDEVPTPSPLFVPALYTPHLQPPSILDPLIDSGVCDLSAIRRAKENHPWHRTGVHPSPSRSPSSPTNERRRDV